MPSAIGTGSLSGRSRRSTAPRVGPFQVRLVTNSRPRSSTTADSSIPSDDHSTRGGAGRGMQ